MAHNLSIRENGMAEMFCAGESAWHGLGQNVSECLTWKDAIETAGLDWRVEKHQLKSHKGASIDAFGIFRADNDAFLGAVGDRYNPIQNHMMGESLDMIIGNIDGAHYESAGALGKGETVWAMAKIPESIRVGEDVSEPYLLFSNSHNGKGAAQVRLTATRVVCENTLNVALKSGSSFFRITHHRESERKVEEAVKAIHGIREQIGGLNGVFNALAGQKLTMEQINAFLNTLMPVKEGEESTRNKNKKTAILSLYEMNDNNAFPEQRGTAFNMLNAVTAYVDHNMSVKGDKDRSRAQSAMFGAGETLKYFAMMELSRMTSVDKSILDLVS